MSGVEACVSCGVEVPVENVTLHALRCCGQPLQQVAVASSSQGSADAESTSSPVAPSTSEVRTEADEPPQQGVHSVAEVASGAVLEDVELEEQPSSADNASPAQGTWQCSRCTFENSQSNTSCEMCSWAFRQDTDDEDTMVDRSDSFTRSAAFRQGKDLLCFVLTAFTGCIIGSIWGLCTGDPSQLMDSAFFGMAMGALFGCVCGQLLCKCRHSQQQRDVTVLPLVDPRAARAQPLLSPAGLEAPRFMRRTRQRNARSEEAMASALLRQHELLEEMLGRMGQMVPHVEAADSHVVASLPTHMVSAEEVQLAPPEHKACTICIEDFREGDEQRTLPCFHRFHKDCVDQWLERNGACPICKHRVDEAQA